MKKAIMIVLAAMLVLSIASIGAIAFRGDPNVQGPNYNEDVHAQLEAAIEKGDYDAWMKVRQENNLPTRGRIFQMVTKENFATFVELHEANEAGDNAKAAQIRAELGLGLGQMKHGAMGQGAGKGQGAGAQTSKGMRNGQGMGAQPSACSGTCPYATT